MAKKTLRAPDPRREAAIHRLIRGWEPLRWDVSFLSHNGGRKLEIYDTHTTKTLAVIDLRALVRKRKPLTGVKKEFAKIVRGSK